MAAAAVKNLPITLTFPDGTRWGAGGPSLELVRPDHFFARLGADGLIGFGEAWMTGDMTTGGWHATASDTAGAVRGRGLRELRTRRPTNSPPCWTCCASGCRCWSPLHCRPCGTLAEPSAGSEENTPTGARENIHRHYDLSNDLFELFLDPSLTYSAAWFETG